VLQKGLKTTQDEKKQGKVFQPEKQNRLIGESHNDDGEVPKQKKPLDGNGYPRVQINCEHNVVGRGIETMPIKVRQKYFLWLGSRQTDLNLQK
jgi:hypothetical protein